jgi:hypothetical protein
MALRFRLHDALANDAHSLATICGAADLTVHAERRTTPTFCRRHFRLVSFMESGDNRALLQQHLDFKELRMHNTVPVNEDGRVLVSAIKDGYNAYLTYTEQLLKLHNENMARLLSDAVAINPWWSPTANETLGEWADLYVSSVESTIEWVRRIQQSPPTAPLARVAAGTVQGNSEQEALNETRGEAADERRSAADVHDEPANDERLMRNGPDSRNVEMRDVEMRSDAPREQAPVAEHERQEDAEQHAPAAGRRGRAGGERSR